MNSFGRAFAMKCFLGTLRRKAKKLIPTIEGRLSLLTANCLKSVGYLHQSNAETLACQEMKGFLTKLAEEREMRHRID